MQWLENPRQFYHGSDFDNSTEAALPGTLEPIPILFQFIVKNINLFSQYPIMQFYYIFGFATPN